MSTPPTIYFPENINYRLGLKQERMWSTEVANGPTGRRQSRPLLVRPKRRMHAQVFQTIDRGAIINVGQFGNNDPGSGPPKLTQDHIWAVQMRVFLDRIQGQYVPFYIFDPASRAYYNLQFGGWNGNGLPLPITYPFTLPIVFPFRGDWTGLANPQAANVTGLAFRPVGGGTTLTYLASDGDFTVSNGTLGTLLTTFTPVIGPAITPGDYDAFVTVDGAHERIPVVMTSDLDDFVFDFDNALPWQELAFSCEEYMG